MCICSDVPEALDYFSIENHGLLLTEPCGAPCEASTWTTPGFEIANTVARFFDDNSMEIEAHSYHYGFDATLQGAALQYWTLKNGPLVANADEEEIQFVVELNCKEVAFRRRRLFVGQLIMKESGEI